MHELLCMLEWLLIIHICLPNEEVCFSMVGTWNSLIGKTILLP